MTPEQLAGAQNAISFLSGLLDEGQSGNGRHEGGRLRSFSRERSGGRSSNEERSASRRGRVPGGQSAHECMQIKHYFCAN